MVKRLRELRNEKGLSQQGLAELIGVTQQSVNKYENHNVQPDMDVLISLAELFETSVDYLVGHTDIRRRIEETSPYDLNAQEEQLVMSFRKLTNNQRESIKSVISSFLDPLDKK